MFSAIFRTAARSRTIYHRCRLNTTSSKKPQSVTTDIDDLGMPVEPTWSVKEFLASYPPPVLEPAHLMRLHKLAALNPPPEGSKEFEKLREDLGELIRLVEAVRTVDLPKSDDEKSGGIPDARIWPVGVGMQFEDDTEDPQGCLKLSPEPHGRDLLKHASETADGYYLVKSERRR